MSSRHMHPPADAEIAHLQQRIYLHRIGLRLSIETAQQAVRERLAAPGMLLAAAGIGFMLERLTRSAGRSSGPRRSSQSSASSALSVLAEAARTGLRFLQSGPGLWLAARFAARATEDLSKDREGSAPRSPSDVSG